MLHVVRIETDRAFAPLVEAGLELIGMEMIAWQREDTGQATFERYLEDPVEAASKVRELRAHLEVWASGEAWQIGVHPLAEADWRDAWKAFFRTERVSPRVLVRPPWEPLPPDPPRCVVELNPGLSFGTGRHFTTRSCLRMLDALSEGSEGLTLLDVGSGSGILAIAGVKLGYAGVTAFDVDPQAVRIGMENAALNGVGGQIAFHECRLGDFRAQAPYDVVVANVQENVLVRDAGVLVACLAPGAGARLILAGLLKAQYEPVRAVYAALGLVPDIVWHDEEWTTFSARRAAEDA